MKISIVTISFNQARFLERAICSVIEQDCDDLEYIVVDPGSTDGSREIIERYSDRIAKVIFEADDGPADGLNKGFAAATGAVAGYINADDALLPGALRQVQLEFERDPALDVVIGHGYIIDEQGCVTRHFRSARFSPERYALGVGIVMQQSTFFSMACYRAVGGFNSNNRVSWDGELLLQMGMAGARTHIVEKYWSLFTIHGESLTGGVLQAEDRLCDRKRYFEMVFGRPENRWDRLRRVWARVQRWFDDPVGFRYRLTDELVGPTRRCFPLK